MVELIFDNAYKIRMHFCSKILHWSSLINWLIDIQIFYVLVFSCSDGCFWEASIHKT